MKVPDEIQRQGPAKGALRAAVLLAALAVLGGCNARTAAVAPPAASDCPPASAARDRDDDLAALFSGGNACIRTLRFRDAGVDWTVQVVPAERPGPLWVLPHDNEDAALVTAAAARTRYGGTIVAVETGGNRLADGTDPNRAFGRQGASCPGGPAAARFTETVLSFRDRRYPVVALHTNGPATAARGGSGTISIEAPPEGAEAFRPPPGVAPVGGEDELVIVAARAPGRDRALMATVRRLNAAGVNVLVETVDPASADCSLSHHAALAGIRPYYNVEVRTGRSALQLEMVSVLMAIAGVRPTPPS